MYSVVIASRAGDALVTRALESIASQTRQPACVLVVVDRSDPIPDQWAVEIERSLPLTTLVQQPGVGMASAVKAGIEAVRTPYIAFLDTDDRWRPEKQARQIALLEGSPGIDAVHCMAVNLRENGDESTTEVNRAQAAMFTSTTFRTDVFTRFGTVDPLAGHYAWLYRWWANARRAGISTQGIDYLGLERLIHEENSWVTGNSEAHGALMAELRRLSVQRRGERA
jgi:glycosyltransferase involved in cell wall biosynthesis